MATQVIVVENPADGKALEAGYPVITVSDYLTRPEYIRQKDLRVINLCRSYRYLSTGYYCSLLGEARHHRVVPSVKTMLDLSSKAMYGLDVEDLDELVHETMGGKRRRSREVEGLTGFTLEIYFGHTIYAPLEELARQIFETFPAPLLRVEFEKEGTWRIASIKPLFLHKLTAGQTTSFIEALDTYSKKRWRTPRSRTVFRYDLAILHDPADPLPPSDPKALKKFIRIGKDLGVDIELIEKKDYARLAEYDGLFIRSTTSIDDYTYRFAKKAQSEGMVVIDDPESILRCTNKVYLAELLKANRVATPRTRIIRKRDLPELEAEFGFPLVLKIPDGSFSRGVVKAENAEQLQRHAAELLRESELILAQEYMYTEFDWRIGVLNREPLYASQYFMSKKHWQIYKHEGGGRFASGAYKTWPLEEVPAKVVSVALKAANLIGDGLYGVDLKMYRGNAYVIEVNDNPSLESGVEDSVLKDALYRRIIEEFVRRMELRRSNRRG